MSTYITAQNQLVDDNFYGKKIKYKLWEPEQGVGSSEFANQVKKAHGIVKQCIPFSDRSDIQGTEIREMVKQYLCLSPQAQRILQTNGFEPKPRMKIEDTLLMRDLLCRYQRESKDRQKYKSVHLNDGYIAMWLMFLDEKAPKLTYSQFSKNTVESYVEWRETKRLPRDRRTGRISAETINKEISEAKRCVEWARAMRIVTEDYNAFYKVKQIKTLENTSVRKALTIEEQTSLLEWLRNSGNPWAHDSVLFLLLTGMRVGDWETIDRIHFNLSLGSIEIHELAVGNLKTGGKTVNASRTLPLTPTLIRLAERGFIFERTPKQTRGERLGTLLKRKRNIDPIPIKVFPHLLRHSYATNFVIAHPDKTAQLCAQIGHASFQTTNDTYARYAKQNNHEQGRLVYREHLHFLENNYFDQVEAPLTKLEWDKKHLWYKEKKIHKRNKAA